MNNRQRKKIDTMLSKLEKIQGEINDMSAEEQEKYDNLPESIQDSDRGSDMENSIEYLDEAANLIDDVIDNLNSAK